MWLIQYSQSLLTNAEQSMKIARKVFTELPCLAISNDEAVDLIIISYVVIRICIPMNKIVPQLWD